MTELMRRRRALMGAQKSTDPNILFEWTPSDGLSNIEIIASSGSPHYALQSDSIRLYVLSSWASQYIFPSHAIEWNGDFEVECEFKEPYGTRHEMFVYTRCVDLLNGYATLNVNDKKFSASNGSAVSISSVPGGKISVRVNRTTRACVCSYYSNDVLVAQSNGSILSTQANRLAIVGIDGALTTSYFDITHLVVRKAV